MFAEDRALLVRLRRVNAAIGDVVVELLNHLDEGELPADPLRVLGLHLNELGRELINRADQIEATVELEGEQLRTG